VEALDSGYSLFSILLRAKENSIVVRRNRHHSLFKMVPTINPTPMSPPQIQFRPPLLI
jgi:hypothetical protein